MLQKYFVNSDLENTDRVHNYNGGCSVPDHVQAMTIELCQSIKYCNEYGALL